MLSCSIYVWDIRAVQRVAGELPESLSYGNHTSRFQHHDCMITAIACCNSMLASADSSGKVLIRCAS